MPSVFTFLSKPEYVLRPRQVVHRLWRVGKAMPETVTIRLPWNAPVTVETRENVGSDIYHYGVFDKIVPEAIWRLLDTGEIAVDVGANIGQNSSAMACRVGAAGRVHAFEPHPHTFPRLAANHAQWPAPLRAIVTLHETALGPEKAEAFIKTDCGYLSGAAVQPSASEGALAIGVERMDDVLPPDTRIGLCKIDVEGRELGVLQGARATLERRAIRDLIFEDFEPQPSPVARLLRENGFTLFELHDGWLKPGLHPLGSAQAGAKHFSYNFLATLEPARARSRFQSPGWRCLLAL